MGKKRDISFDILRAIGIVLIILAHVSLPGVIFQVRNFDVVLLVIISGYFSYRSYIKSNHKITYYRKRFLRIILPVWIFLVVYYIIKIFILKSPEPFHNIIDSFLFGERFGYVWIFRVYLLTTLLLPLFAYFYQNLDTRKYLLCLLVMFILYEFLIFLVGKNNVFINTVIYYTIGFGICFGIGVVLDKMSKKQYIIITVSNFILFIICMFYFYLKTGSFVTSNACKYPPELYYLSYGLFASCVSIFIITKTNIKEKLHPVITKILSFIGSHTMWIYLWHIAILKILQACHIYFNWMIMFVMILFISCILTWLQSVIVRKTNNQFAKIYFDC